MKIIVCVKQVPDTSEVKIDNKKGTLIRDGVQSILNPYDATALEEALKIKDKYSDTTVTVITMGPPQAKEILQECIAMGADDAVLLSDRALGGSDTWATSNALSAGIKKLGEYSIIFTGQQSIDGETAQVGPQLAEKLGLPQVTYVTEFELLDDKLLKLKRELDNGYEIIKIKMPCVISTMKELNIPRYMSVKGILKGANFDIKTYNSADIGVDLTSVGLEASPTKVSKTFVSIQTSKGIMIKGDTPEELAENLLKKLRATHVI
ncbi:MAG: electron transfer flavoprotein subunit beta/FixA family protein [Sedimentibacter sp.]|uniref:electron transfer flavoprotein subunit beta/FixA family protein n=1 Tax=Sedimentibacter sp. TaxID=1960295 RepID=UPI00315882B3